MPAKRRLKGMRAVVTGASSGVGRAIALALAGEGAVVAALGRRSTELEAVARACRRRAGKAFVFRADFLEAGAVRELGGPILKALGGVDILVHSAATIALGPIATADVADLDRQFACNVRAPFLLTQLLLPSLAARRGQVVFINSTVGLQARAGVSQYAATKHALKAVADSLREEVNAAGVRVFSVYLGRTATPMQEQVHAFEGRDYDPSRFLQPEDVAGAVLGALTAAPAAELTDLTLRPMRKG